jgi:hypothetical protein
MVTDRNKYQCDLNAVRVRLSSCESGLMLTHAAEWVATLQNVPRKLGAVRSGWKRGSHASHGLHIHTMLLEDE